MAFVDFVSVELISPILRRSEQTEQYVPCLSAEKNMSVFFHHFPHFPNLIMLIMMLLHLRSAIADHCRRQPHMLLWCRYRAISAMGLQAANSPFVNLRSAHLSLRYVYRSGTILVLLLSGSTSLTHYEQINISILWLFIC